MIRADARHIPLKDESVQCVVTSPPYWALRDYGIGEQGIGLEPTPELYVQHIVEVFREVRRVLRKDGTVWLNLGDSYAGSGEGGGGDRKGNENGQHDAMRGLRPKLNGLKPKDLVGIPWRVAFALQADGWWLRSDIIWSKPNPMPESVTDRPTKSHEYIFLLSKSADYFYDAEAIKEPRIQDGRIDTWWRPSRGQENGRGNHSGNEQSHEKLTTQAYRNKRTVWEVATQPYPDAHFATFPEDLIKPCILAGTSQRGACSECGAPWERVVEIDRHATRPNLSSKYGGLETDLRSSGAGNVKFGLAIRTEATVKTLGWQPTCDHRDSRSSSFYADTRPCIVLDPFAGSGTTVKVAQDLGRVGVGLDLKPDYLKMARVRTAQQGLRF